VSEVDNKLTADPIEFGKDRGASYAKSDRLSESK